jgi:heterodisulfide reductase subunit A-like polyferredoxin
MPEEKGSILVVGGGISGMTAAVEAAETGYEVLLVEKRPYLGGRVVQMNRYFPKLCPPYCGLEINLRRIRQNPRIRCFTLSEVSDVSGQAGGYEVVVKVNPRYVNQRCTSCEKCVEACPIERPNEFNYGMDKTKAIYLPHEMSFPMRYVIDDEVCTRCGACVEVCKYGAIDLEMEPKTLEFKVASIVLATGWQPYDVSRVDNLGFGIMKNVITNVMMERLAASNGPTGGRILRPSDGGEVKRVAFVQCAGSRDENHLPYCSAVCCLASLKQATYIREQNPESKVFIFYIDVRAMGRYEDFYTQVERDEGVTLVKGKVAKITEVAETGDLIVEAEDVSTGVKSKEIVNLVVLACGMVPEDTLPFDVVRDEYGFAAPRKAANGIYPIGVAKRPQDVARAVQDATGSVIQAIQFMVR